MIMLSVSLSVPLTALVRGLPAVFWSESVCHWCILFTDHSLIGTWKSRVCSLLTVRAVLCVNIYCRAVYFLEQSLSSLLVVKCSRRGGPVYHDSLLFSLRFYVFFFCSWIFIFISAKIRTKSERQGFKLNIQYMIIKCRYILAKRINYD